MGACIRFQSPLFFDTPQSWKKQVRIRKGIMLWILIVLSHSVMSNSLQPPGLRLLCPCNFSGKNTGVGCHFLLQGIFPTQGSNPCLLCLLHWQADSLPLSHLGNPQIEKWVKISHLCLILCHPMDYTVHRIPQARILEWVAFHSFREIFPTQGPNPGLPHCRQILVW